MQFNVELGDRHEASITLEDVSVHVCSISATESDLGGLFRDATALLDLSTLVSTNFATVCHNDDLFEERNSRTAHSDFSRIEATRAGCGEPQQLFPVVTHFGFGGSLIVDRFAEVDGVRCDLRFRVLLRVGRLLGLFLESLHFGQKRLLLCCRCLHRFVLPCWNQLGGRLVLCMLCSVFFDSFSSLVDVVAHGLVVLDRAQKLLVDASDIGVWRVRVLHKTVA